MQAVDLGRPLTNMTKPKNQLFCRLDGLDPSARKQLRLTTLNKLGLLVSEAVPIFEEATQKASTFSGAPISILGLVVKEELWFKSAVGLSTTGLTDRLAEERKISLHESFSTYVIDSQQPLIIDDTYSSKVFANSLLTQHYGIRTYLGVPLISSSGLCIGTLEVMDWAERKFDVRDIDHLALLARWCLGEFERKQLIKTQPNGSTTSFNRPQWQEDRSLISGTDQRSTASQEAKFLLQSSPDLSPEEADKHQSSGISQPHRGSTYDIASSRAVYNKSHSHSSPYFSNSEEERLDLSLSTLVEQDDQAIEAASAATNPIKIKLLSQLTQELRTPLTSVIGMASVLHREVYGPLTTKQREYLEIIHNSGQNLITLVDEIVSLGVLNEHSEVDTAAVDIEMLCQQVVNSVTDIAEQHQQTLRLTIEPGNRIWSLDKEKVRQALYYLIISVLEMSEAGGEVKIHISKRDRVLNIAVGISHPWLGEDFGEVKLRSQAVTQALNYSRSNFDEVNADGGQYSLGSSAIKRQNTDAVHNYNMDAGNIALSNHQVLTASALMMTIDQEAVGDNPNKIPRDILGLLFCCHLIELHQGRVVVQGSPNSSYRYLLQFPQAESSEEMNKV